MMTTSIINNSNQKIINQNLSKWDELTPLKETQIKSILLLSELNQFQLDEFDSLNFDSSLANSNENDQAIKEKSVNDLHQVRKMKNNFI